MSTGVRPVGRACKRFGGSERIAPERTSTYTGASGVSGTASGSLEFMPGSRLRCETVTRLAGEGAALSDGPRRLTWPPSLAASGSLAEP
jgi:hypothetical protein